ncbi:MAG: NAD-dependent epimerase/dehydratase family protein [Candidatus Tectomicrobia bacterium]|uniref:NAD-dependent epimerase/dehydratase family protein n=1 Tax=Tectimicrobiota bacterium TaxID=2528274 RepID=A0A932MNA2_UNCTE|nr:NAD-dependent epimerase/dehydratase family protein [Candidatus Tectomicrobia bacterium]
MSNEQDTALPTHLVTGAAGFIASKVCERLLEQGHRVVALDNLNDAYDLRLKEWRLGQLKGRPGFEFHRLDIGDLAGLRALFERGAPRAGEPPWAAVLNLAARAGVRQSVENPWVYYETNVMGTLNLLELCREFGVRKFVLASTSSAYGDGTPVPFREEAPTDRPLSPYAASKKAAEVLCSTYHFLYGIDVTVLRYFTVYGPAGRPDMSLFRFVQWIAEGKPVQVFGDGRQERDFTFVEDIARGTVAALKPLGYEIINLGSDQPVMLMDAVRKVEELLEKKAQIEYQDRHQADVLRTWASIEKAERLLGWRPQVPFGDGAARLVEWYMANRSWTSQIRT